MRPLILHVSALNDAEYKSYTSCLNDLIDAQDDPQTLHDDSYYERISVGVRELRAWLRGRYPELSVGDVDSILKFFHASVTPGDALTGGQFFAVLRLITHARAGKTVDRSLVFIQAYPDTRTSRPQTPLQRTRPGPFRRASDASQSSDSPSPGIPHTRRKSSESQIRPPQHPDTRPPPPPVPLKPNNPFLTRRLKSASGTADDVPPKLDNIPPLPPRKPPPLLPPRHASLVVSPTGSSTSSAQSTVLKPAASAPTSSTGATKVAHAVTPLMRQSLEASKVGQTVRAMEERLGKERILEVVKSSTTSTAGTSRSRSFSPAKGMHHPNHRPNETQAASSSSLSSGSGADTKPVLPARPRRRASPQSSIGSMRSFEQVANASVNTNPFGTLGLTEEAAAHSPYTQSRPSHRSPSCSPERDVLGVPSKEEYTPSTPKPPPPTHPDRKPPASLSNVFDLSPPNSPTTGSGMPRVGRSKSMHHPSPPPLPPPRRRRPDSVQFVGTSIGPANGDKDYQHPSPTPTFPSSSLSRHLSLSSHNANFQRTLSRFQDRAGAVRYKAEAGMSRRGFVSYPGHSRKEGEEALMDGADVDVDNALESGEESLDGGDGDRRRLRADFGERDNLKWPAGEGWAPL